MLLAVCSALLVKTIAVPLLTAVFMKVGVATVVLVEEGEAEEMGMALGTLEMAVEAVEEVDEETAVDVDCEAETVLDVDEGDEMAETVEEVEEETATVNTVLELLLVATVDVEGGTVVVCVENPPNVVCNIVVCKIVVVTGCRHTAAMPLPAKNFPINSVCDAETPAHAFCRNAVSVCRPSMQASEHPRVGEKSLAMQLLISAS